MQTIEGTVQLQEAGARLDTYLSSTCCLSRSVAQQLIREGDVQLNGAKVLKSYRVVAGDSFAITFKPPQPSRVLPQAISLDIIYEDSDLLVVNKPKGMVVHPAPGNPDGTLVNAVLHHCGVQLSGVGGAIRPGIVHRIDKDTSGLLVVAKNDATHQGLAQQFAAHTITRVYRAVVYGNFKEDEGQIDAPIGRDRQNRKKMAVTQENAKKAVTYFKVLERFNGFSHLALQLKTGRTHQIRVHMASVGHPVAGDVVYGPRKAITQLHGQCLHAQTLGFVHPKTGKTCLFDSELPPYFTTFLTSVAAR